MSDIYKQALRQNLRFEFKGLRSTEELFQLTPDQLDSLYQQLNAKRKAISEESLLSKPNKETKILDLQLSIIKDLVATLLQEEADREAAANNSARKQKLLELIERKQQEELGNLSIEELQNLAKEL